LPTVRFTIEKVARGEKSRARALVLPRSGMVGQGDTGEAEQSSRPHPSAHPSFAAAAASAAAAMLLMSAYIRVLGEAYVHLWFSAPNAAVNSDLVADADPAVGGITAARAEHCFPAYIYAWRIMMPARKAAMDKEMLVAPNALSAPSDTLAQSISTVPYRFQKFPFEST
jgi:hypothetical protein